MKKIAIIALICAWAIPSALAQELNCKVNINAQAVQNAAEREIYVTMQTAIRDFMNNTRWTNDVYKNNERIECSLTIMINERVSVTDFKATITIQSNRPVYNSDYNTPLLTYNDKTFNFEYVEFQPMEFNENSFSSNLTATLAYYAFIVIGLDYDSYSPMGGTPFYQKASQIVTNGQNTQYSEWRSDKGLLNRYWLVENLLSKTYEPIRQAIYDYHRLGLDKMYENPAAARQNITLSFNQLLKAHKNRPGSALMQMRFRLEES